MSSPQVSAVLLQVAALEAKLLNLLSVDSSSQMRSMKVTPSVKRRRWDS